MNNDEWQTKQEDMLFVKEVISHFGGDEHLIGIFEIGFSETGELQKIRLSEWVQLLTQHFQFRYGKEKADFIMRKVISESFIADNTVH